MARRSRRAVRENLTAFSQFAARLEILLFDEKVAAHSTFPLLRGALWESCLHQT